MIRISESVIKDYLVCPKRVHYRINMPEESIATNAMALGTAVHTTLEKAWRSSKEALLELEIQLDKNNVKISREYAYKSIANFFKSFQELVSEDDVIEKYFRIPVGNDIFLTGKLDRVSNGIVIDWKTGATEPEDIERDTQCMFYYTAYKKLYGKEPAGVYLVFLAKNKIISFVPNLTFLNEFENNTIPFVINGIRSNWYPRNGLFSYKACKNCSFQNICYTELGILE